MSFRKCRTSGGLTRKQCRKKFPRSGFGKVLGLYDFVADTQIDAFDKLGKAIGIGKVGTNIWEAEKAIVAAPITIPVKIIKTVIPTKSLLFIKEQQNDIRALQVLLDVMGQGLIALGTASAISTGGLSALPSGTLAIVGGAMEVASKSLGQLLNWATKAEQLKNAASVLDDKIKSIKNDEERETETRIGISKFKNDRDQLLKDLDKIKNEIDINVELRKIQDVLKDANIDIEDLPKGKPLTDLEKQLLNEQFGLQFNKDGKLVDTAVLGAPPSKLTQAKRQEILNIRLKLLMDEPITDIEAILIKEENKEDLSKQDKEKIAKHTNDLMTELGLHKRLSRAITDEEESQIYRNVNYLDEQIKTLEDSLIVVDTNDDEFFEKHEKNKPIREMIRKLKEQQRIETELAEFEEEELEEGGVFVDVSDDDTDIEEEFEEEIIEVVEPDKKIIDLVKKHGEKIPGIIMDKLDIPKEEEKKDDKVDISIKEITEKKDDKKKPRIVIEREKRDEEIKELHLKFIKDNNINLDDIPEGGTKKITKNGITLTIKKNGRILGGSGLVVNKNQIGLFNNKKTLKQLKEEQKKLEKELDDIEDIDEEDVPGGPPIVSTITKKTKKKVVKKKGKDKSEIIVPTHTDADNSSGLGKDLQREFFNDRGVKLPENFSNVKALKKKTGNKGLSNAAAQKREAVIQMNKEQTGTSLFNELAQGVLNSNACETYLRNNAGRIRLLNTAFRNELRDICKQLLGKKKLKK